MLGLIKVVQLVFSEYEHKLCVIHLYKNLNKVHKGDTVKNNLLETCNIDFIIYLGEENGADEDLQPKSSCFVRGDLDGSKHLRWSILR